MEEQQMLKAASRTVSTCDLSFFSDRSRQNEKEKTAKRGCLDGNPGRGMLLYMHDVFFFFYHRVISVSNASVKAIIWCMTELSVRKTWNLVMLHSEICATGL